MLMNISSAKFYPNRKKNLDGTTKLHLRPKQVMAFNAPIYTNFIAAHRYDAEMSRTAVHTQVGGTRRE